MWYNYYYHGVLVFLPAIVTAYVYLQTQKRLRDRAAKQALV